MLMVDSALDSDLRAVAGSSVLRFCKMQALGNDFVVVGEDELARALSAMSQPPMLSLLAVSLCARRFGVGADGFIVVRRGSAADSLSWTYLNSDGSISLMCGNGLRCLALWAVQHNWIASGRFVVETGCGPVQMTFKSAESISSDLGEPLLAPAEVPIDLPGSGPVIDHDLQVGDEKFKISAVSLGNPHCVIFENGFNEKLMQARAERLQESPFFPEGVNVEFVEVLSKKHVKVIVYERGCGRTLACASGAAAVAVAAVLSQRCERELTVELEGGSLQISWSEEDNHVRVSGPAAFVYEGRIDLDSEPAAEASN